MDQVFGTIHSQSAQPVAGARVFIVSGTAPYPEIAAVTGPDGAFHLPVQAPGRYEVRCVADGCAPATLTVDVPSPTSGSGVELTVAPATP